jgi:hypothetical protein
MIVAKTQLLRVPRSRQPCKREGCTVAGVFEFVLFELSFDGRSLQITEKLGLRIRYRFSDTVSAPKTDAPSGAESRLRKLYNQ